MHANHVLGISSTAAIHPFRFAFRSNQNAHTQCEQGSTHSAQHMSNRTLSDHLSPTQSLMEDAPIGSERGAPWCARYLLVLYPLHCLSPFPVYPLVGFISLSSTLTPFSWYS